MRHTIAVERRVSLGLCYGENAVAETFIRYE